MAKMLPPPSFQRLVALDLLLELNWKTLPTPASLLCLNIAASVSASFKQVSCGHSSILEPPPLCSKSLKNLPVQKTVLAAGKLLGFGA